MSGYVKCLSGGFDNKKTALRLFFIFFIKFAHRAADRRGQATYIL